MIRKFLKDRRGNVAMLFGLTAMPIMFAVGAGVDLADVVAVKDRAQIALDAAALAANRQGYDVNAGDVKARARSSFDANFIASGATVTKFDAVPDGEGKVTVTASVSVKTSFAPLLGFDHIDFDIMSETVVGEATFDVVMVLDNSGSMAGTKIDTLKDAASDLAKTLFAANTRGQKDRVKVGVVPFTAFVNVDRANDNAEWLDQDGISPIHSTNFETAVNRFDLFKNLNGVHWQGCVEARPYPYDVSDDPADPAVPATMFVPQFAPDEPDSDYRFDKRVFNDWISDTGGSCKAADGEPQSYSEAQKRVCKYNKARPGFQENGIRRGPNYGCKSVRLQPLSEHLGPVQSKIAEMKADGYTNIQQGVAWGWRVLSPQEPFTGGRRPEDVPNGDYRRIMIVMTDGANTYEWLGSPHRYPNISKYNAHGYVTEGRLGVTGDDYGSVTTEMDDRTLETCTNAKEDGGVLIYTVAFQVNDYATKKMLRDCASKPEMAYQSNSNSELTLAFANIAQEITRLRVSR